MPRIIIKGGVWRNTEVCQIHVFYWKKKKAFTLFCVILRCILTLKVDILTLICSKETGSIASFL